MEQILSLLMRRLAALVPNSGDNPEVKAQLPAPLPLDFSTPIEPIPNLIIDEDCGQLEAIASGLDQYPVTFPCLLISIAEVQWENLRGENVQRGVLTLDVKLAFDVYDDTRPTAGRRTASDLRQLQSRSVHILLNGLQLPVAQLDSLRRSISRSYAMPGGIIVYETLYRATVFD